MASRKHWRAKLRAKAVPFEKNASVVAGGSIYRLKGLGGSGAGATVHAWTVHGQFVPGFVLLWHAEVKRFAWTINMVHGDVEKFAFTTAQEAIMAMCNA